MIRTLVTKELRETGWIAAVAAALLLVIASPLMGGPTFWEISPDIGLTDGRLPFLTDGFLISFCWVAGALGIALGFRQSAWEPYQGTALYLLHRPVQRNAIYLVKLATGMTLFLLATFLPIGIYAVWAATPGSHAAPFEWSMTATVLKTWLAMPVIYLGAFASGLRPARWYGSRLLPLAAAVVPLGALEMMPHWWLLGFPFLLLVAGWLFNCILFEAQTRDF